MDTSKQDFWDIDFYWLGFVIILRDNSGWRIFDN